MGLPFALYNELHGMRIVVLWVWQFMGWASRWRCRRVFIACNYYQVRYFTLGREEPSDVRTNAVVLG